MIMIEHKCYNMALRNIFVLLLLGMFSTAHEASAFGNQIISKPKYYSMFADDLSIESVMLDSKFTIVKLVACGHKGDTIRLSPTAVVVDEKGHDYHFVKGKNIDSNGRIVIGNKGQTVAEAYFEPMPVETKVFDLIETRFWPTGRRFIAVRDSGTPITLYSDNGKTTLDEADFMPGMAHLSGRVCDSALLRNGKIKLLFDVGRTNLRDGKYGNAETTIDSLGFFHIDIPLLCLRVCYMYAYSSDMSKLYFHLPILLTPNSHSQLDIHDISTRNPSVACRNDKYDFSHLLNNMPSFRTVIHYRTFPDVATVVSEWLSLEGIKGKVCTNDTICSYLAAKYNMSFDERMILRSHAVSCLAADMDVCNMHVRDNATGEHIPDTNSIYSVLRYMPTDYVGMLATPELPSLLERLDDVASPQMHSAVDDDSPLEVMEDSVKLQRIELWTGKPEGGLFGQAFMLHTFCTGRDYYPADSSRAASIYRQIYNSRSNRNYHRKFQEMLKTIQSDYLKWRKLDSVE